MYTCLLHTYPHAPPHSASLPSQCQRRRADDFSNRERFAYSFGIGHGDGEEQVQFLAEKTANLRIFEDEHGKTNLSVLDVKGEAIVVSQFTLYADSRKGRRPSFIDAALPDVAEPLVNRFVELLRSHGVSTQTGKFGSHMEVEIHNDGPVTIWLEK